MSSLDFPSPTSPVVSPRALPSELGLKEKQELLKQDQDLAIKSPRKAPPPPPPKTDSPSGGAASVAVSNEMQKQAEPGIGSSELRTFLTIANPSANPEIQKGVSEAIPVAVAAELEKSMAKVGFDKSPTAKSMEKTAAQQIPKSEIEKPADEKPAFRAVPKQEKSESMKEVFLREAVYRRLDESRSPIPADIREELKPDQLTVLHQTETVAAFRAEEDRKKALDKLASIGIPEGERAEALEKIKELMSKSPLTLNFDGQNVDNLTRMEKKGTFVTMWDAQKGVFSEGHTGKRDQVERRMHGYGDKPFEVEGFQDKRPVYMALNLGSAVLGAAENYGGSYFVCKSRALDKATLSSSDTFTQDFEDQGSRVGNKNHLEGIIAGMNETSLRHAYNMATGKKDPLPMPDNRFIEAQVASPNWKDVEKVVLDRNEVAPGSEVEKRWESLAEKNGFKIEFYDSKEWKNKARTVNVATANAECGPVPKSSEKSSKNVTADNINTFMKEMGLAHLPNEHISLGMRDLKQLVNSFSGSVNNKEAPSVDNTTSLGKVFKASQPYANEYETVQMFAKNGNEAFMKFVAKLPTDEDVQKAKDQIAALKKKGESAAKIEKLEIEYEKLKEGAELRKRIGNDTFEMLTSNPVTHSRQYLMLAGEFKKHLDKKDVEQMKGAAKEMRDVEKAYQNRLAVLRDVALHPDFQKQLPLMVPDMKLIPGKMKEKAAWVGAQAKEMAFNAQGMVAFLEKFSNSVNADPAGWMKQLRVIPPPPPASPKA